MVEYLIVKKDNNPFNIGGIRYLGKARWPLLKGIFHSTNINIFVCKTVARINFFQKKFALAKW